MTKRIQKVPDTKSSPYTLIQKSCVFKLFHSRERIQKVPFPRIFLCGYVRCSVDGRPNRDNKVAFSNLSGIVSTRPKIMVAGVRGEGGGGILSPRARLLPENFVVHLNRH